MANYITDDFNRADNASSLGSPTSGGPYTVRVGTAGIQTNRGYFSASTANAHVTFPAHADVDLQVTMPVIAANSGPVFRWVDTSNYWSVIPDSGTWKLVRNNAGSGVIYMSTGLTAANNDVVRVITKGRYIYTFINGLLMAQYDDEFLSVATSTCGLRSPSNTTARFDTLTADDAPTTIPGGIDGAASLIYYDQFAGTFDLAGLVYKGRNTATDDAPTGVA